MILLAIMITGIGVFIIGGQAGGWQPMDNVVKLKAVGLYGDGWQGTAFFIADNLLVTAGHCVADANEIILVLADGKEMQAIDWYSEPEVDIGIIEILTPEKERRLGFDNAELGEEVLAVGNPYGVYPTLNRGIVSALDVPDAYWFQKNMLIVDCPLHPGNSGCPVFDKQNNVLGVCSWGYSPVMTCCVPSDIVELVIQKYKAAKALREAE